MSALASRCSHPCFQHQHQLRLQLIVVTAAAAAAAGAGAGVVLLMQWHRQGCQLYWAGQGLQRSEGQLAVGVAEVA